MVTADILREKPMANMPLLRITQRRENADTFHVEVAFEGPRVRLAL